MKKLTEKEVRKAIESVRTEEDAMSVMNAYFTAQPALASYVEEASSSFNQAEKMFLMTATSTVWNVLADSGHDAPQVTREMIGRTVSDIDREIRPVLERAGDDTLASMQAIVGQSSQGELLTALIGILLSATEDDAEDRVRDESLQPLFFRIMIVIEVLSRTGTERAVH